MGTVMWFTISSFVSLAITLVVEAAFLVVAFVVKRSRPDVFGLLLGSVIFQFFATVFGFSSSFTMPFLVDAAGGIEMSGLVTFATSMTSRLISVVGTILLLMAIVRLARDPRAEAP